MQLRVWGPSTAGRDPGELIALGQVRGHVWIRRVGGTEKWARECGRSAKDSGRGVG